MNELRDMIIEDFKLLFEKNSKTIELAIARRDNLRAEAMEKIALLEAQVTKMDSALVLAKRNSAMQRQANDNLRKENYGLRQELRTLKDVVDLQGAISDLLARVR